MTVFREKQQLQNYYNLVMDKRIIENEIETVSVQQGNIILILKNGSSIKKE